MQKILVIFNMQNDLIKSRDEKNLEKAIYEYIKTFEGRTIYLRETRSYEHSADENICVEDTKGWEITDAFFEFDKDIVIDKSDIPCTELFDMLSAINEMDKIDEVQMAGISQDNEIEKNLFGLKGILEDCKIEEVNNLIIKKCNDPIDM